MFGYGPEVALPPPTVIRGTPQPPAPVPHVASRAVPLPAPNRPLPDSCLTHAPAIGSRRDEIGDAARAGERSAVSADESRANRAGSVSPRAGERNRRRSQPAPVIQPTQQMPVAQGLE